MHNSLTLFFPFRLPSALFIRSFLSMGWKRGRCTQSQVLLSFFILHGHLLFYIATAIIHSSRALRISD
jgi:hypothetical protein